MDAMDFKKIVERTKDIPSSVFEAEQRQWWGVLESNPNIKHIVDFGTGWGKSAVTLALVCPRAKVLTFDNGHYYVKNNIVKTYNDYFSQVEEYRQGIGNLTQFVGDSLGTDWEETLTLHFGTSLIDVLNYDSEWQNLDHIRKELSLWLPRIRSGGYLFVHDYKHNKHPEVRQAMDEVQKRFGLGTYQLTSTADCGQYTAAAFKKL